MHAKSRAIKTFITEFTTILLDEFPVTLDSLVFMGFSMKLIHDLDTHTTHSTAHVLDNMETIQHDFSVWKKLFSQVIVRAKHIHSNDFHLTAHGSIVAKKVIPDDSLCSSFKNSDDIKIIKILSNKTHLSLSKGILVPRHNLREVRKIRLKTEVIKLANNS